MEFYENLKYLRKEANLTQEQLAEKLNVSRQAVTKWESGQSMPDIQNLKEMSDMFGVTMDNLVGNIKNKKESIFKKKIEDIGFYIFGALVVLMVCAYSIGEYINIIIDDNNVKIVSYIIIAIISFIIFILFIKKYLKSTDKAIINMKNTTEAKKERKKYIIKKYIYYDIMSNIVFAIILSLPSIQYGLNIFMFSVLKGFLELTFLNAILGIIEYKKLEKKVKELNKCESES